MGMAVALELVVVGAALEMVVVSGERVEVVVVLEETVAVEVALEEILLVGVKDLAVAIGEGVFFRTSQMVVRMNATVILMAMVRAQQKEVAHADHVLDRIGEVDAGIRIALNFFWL